MTYLEGTAWVVHVLFVATESTADVRNDFRRRTRYGAPAGGEDGGENQLVGGKVTDELHGKDLTEHSTRGHDIGMCQIRVGESNEMGAHDETGVSCREVVELGIFEHERPYDGEVDVRSSELSGCCVGFNKAAT